MKIRKLFLAIALAVLSINAFACKVTNTTTNEIKIIFVNGIQNQIEDACASMEKISTIVGAGKYSYSYFYNPADLDTTDQRELVWQAHISNTALKQFGYTIDDVKNDLNKKINYYSLLGGLYKSNIDNPTQSTATGSILNTTSRLVTRIKAELSKSTTAKVVLVAHSQGNFYVEAAFAIIVTEALAKGDIDSTNLVNRLRIVGVASVAGSTPNNRYLSHENDVAVFTGQNAVAFFSESNYKPLKGNDVACAAPCSANSFTLPIALYAVIQKLDGSIDYALHNFLDIYTNSKIVSYNSEKSFPSIILGLISESINELNPPVSTIKQFQINAIAFQSQVGSLTQYSTGLVLYMPTSTEYDNATVSGLGTASQPDGIVRLKDNGLSYLQTIVTQYGLTTVGDSVFRLPNTLTSTEIPAGTQYTVKIYKGTTLVATQTITLAGRVFSPSEMTTGMFSRLAPLTYAQLCPNNVATTDNWYTTPSSIALDPDYTTPKGINATLFCSPTAPYTASARVEFGDNLNRRFMSTNTLVKP